MTITGSMACKSSVARIFNTYGPRMHPEDGRVVSNFIVQALKGEPISHIRRWQPDALLLLRRRPGDRACRLWMRHDDLKGAVNLGNPEEITIAELARRIVDLVGSPSKIQFFPLPQDDPRQRCPDITRASELLGWRPRVGLEDGLKRTIAYFDKLLSIDATAQQSRLRYDAARPRVDRYMVGLRETARGANGAS